MNDRFFSLPKEKQDNMINAAIKVFALNGYDRASTDVIIREAGISKGLLFHYFGNKINLYKFVSEYCARYLMVELSAGVSDSARNLVDRVILMEKAKLKMLQQYPYIDLFMISLRGEGHEEASETAMRWAAEVNQCHLNVAAAKADRDLLRGGVSKDSAYEVIELLMDGYKLKAYRRGDEPEAVLKGLMPYLEIIKKNFTK